MAVSTRKPFSCAVICVAERVAISTRVGGRGPVSLLVVTDAARCHLSTRVGLTLRRMTGVAVVVGGKVRRDRQTRAATHGGVMTACATSLRACGTDVVLGMIEFDVEPFVEARGKTLQRRIVAGDIRVADNAHRYRRRCELRTVTVSARLMTWETWRCRVVGSLVTRVAGEGTVTLTRVKES
jgi:hypothetical protein